MAVVAHWDRGNRVGPSTVALLRALSSAGFESLLVSTAQGAGSLDWVGGRPRDITVLRRPNLGYDFGSWATALDRYPTISSAPSVLFFNDSLVGPFISIDHLLRQFQQSDADAWGITDTYEIRHHLQSYCLGFRGGCLQAPSLQSFWQKIREEPTREEVIERYEIGLSLLLDQEGFTADAAIPSRRVVKDGGNPTIGGWRRLLAEGFPFVKRQLLREPGLVPDGRMVRGELLRRYSVDVDWWL